VGHSHSEHEVRSSDDLWAPYSKLIYGLIALILKRHEERARCFDTRFDRA